MVQVFSVASLRRTQWCLYEAASKGGEMNLVQWNVGWLLSPGPEPWPLSHTSSVIGINKTYLFALEATCASPCECSLQAVKCCRHSVLIKSWSSRPLCRRVKIICRCKGACPTASWACDFACSFLPQRESWPCVLRSLTDIAMILVYICLPFCLCQECHEELSQISLKSTLGRNG